MKRFSSLLVAISIVVSAQASATYTCIGPVKGLTISPKSGQVLAENISGIEWPVLCNINVVENGVTPESCKNIYSMLLTAQVSKKNVTLWFNDEETCLSHPAWSALTGWYFGPKLND